MTCPDLGFWRAWLDNELNSVDDAALDPDPAAHLDGCAECRALVVDLRRNAALASAAIHRLAPASLPSPAATTMAAATAATLRAGRGDRETGAATATGMATGGDPRLITTDGTEPEPGARHDDRGGSAGMHDGEEKRSMARVLPFERWRFVMSGLAAALLLMLVVGTPQGREAAAQFLAQFRGERFEAVSLSSDQIANVEQTLSDLRHLGRISGLDTLPEPRPVASVAEASQFVGFPVLEPDPATLPTGIGSTPAEVRVMPAHQVRFTFDLEQARAYFQSVGRSDISLPERFDGASLVVNTPPAVVLEYRRAGTSADAPSGLGLLIGQAGAVTADAEGGVTLEELRMFLLGLPGLSPETVRQLQEIEDWRTTLPVPIPVERIAWERTTIAGEPGLLLNDNTGLGSAAIWQRDGRIFGIVGGMKARELRHVAESLR